MENKKMATMRKMIILVTLLLGLCLITGCSEVQTEQKVVEEVQEPSTEEPVVEPQPIEEVQKLAKEETFEGPLDEETAISKLMDAGCQWNISSKEVCIKYAEPKWVILSEACDGICEIDEMTGEITISEHFMCYGASYECETDEDCQDPKFAQPNCASKYICTAHEEYKFCTPVFD